MCHNERANAGHSGKPAGILRRQVAAVLARCLAVVVECRLDDGDVCAAKKVDQRFDDACIAE